MYSHFKKITASIVLSLVAFAGNATEYHVSKNKLSTIEESLQARTITEIAKKVKAGDTVIIHNGIYRETVYVNASGTKEAPIIFKNAPGEKVEISGADVLQTWQKEASAKAEDNIYVADWQPIKTFHKSSYIPENDYHKMVGNREQITILGIKLKQVLSLDKMERGTFFADNKNGKLYFWHISNDNLIKNEKPRAEFKVEANRRHEVWVNKGAHIKLKGLYFRQAANHGQQGAVKIFGDYNSVEYCTFEDTNSVGANFKGKNLFARKCTFQNNGQLGFSAVAAHNSLMTECVITENGWKGYKLDWEAGGDKIVFCDKFIMEKCIVTKNRGNGIWYDIGNENSEVRNCLIMNNQNCGIFYEISFSLHAHDNIILYNGLRSTYNAWGMSAGISLSSSPKCTIERNILIGNKEGFSLREQNRKSGLIEHDIPKFEDWKRGNEVAVWNHDHVVKNNIIANNRDAQIWGWFAVKDKRHLPDTPTQKVTTDEKGYPVGLNLEDLNLNFENNFYSTNNGYFPYLKWGVSWHEDKVFINSIEEVQKTLNLDKMSTEIEFPFANITALDFRVSNKSKLANAYPQGEIPGVLLSNNK